MRLGCASVVAIALGACNFDGSVPSTLAEDGDGSPIGGPDASTVDADPRAPDAEPPCELPFIIDDHFENTDLETAGSMSSGDGFTEEKNNTTGNGSAAEIAGELFEIRTSSEKETGAAPAHGAASITSFPFDSANGMTIRLEVAAADTPIWNGIVLGVQSNQASTDGSGDSLMLRVRGSQPGAHAFTIGMGTHRVNDNPVKEQPYDESALADGFVITWVLHADSWSYVAEGFLLSGAPISDSGAYGVGETPADLLDDTTLHLGVHMQGTTGDAQQRIMQVRRVSLMTGVCR